MKQIVLGIGEVGSPLRAILQADGYDPCVQPWTILPIDRYDVLHVAIPYSHRFLTSVREAQTIWGPRLTIIHSTVPIGTTAQLDHAVHSPTQGQHETMRRDLLRIPKVIGGPWAEKARGILEHAGFVIHRCYPQAEQTEALKLLCLAKYGTYIAFSHYAKEIGAKVGLTSADIMGWDKLYNAYVTPSSVRRPLIAPQHERITGHCVIDGVKLLQRDYPDALLDGVLARG